jgi:flagellar protein FliT
MSGAAHYGIVERYEFVAQLTAEMRAAAQAGCWEQLLGIEAGCREIFERLIADEEAAPRHHPPEVLARKAALIRQILADDAAIRRLVEPRLAELERWLGGVQRDRLLRDAYAAGGAA